MSKVYVVTHGCYSDREIVGVFSDEKAAEAFASCDEDGGFEEWEVDSEKLSHEHPHGKQFYSVYLDRDGDPHRGNRPRLRSHSPIKAQPSMWYRDQEGIKPDYWLFNMWATDEEHAVKIANERRARVVANNQWNMTYEQWKESEWSGGALSSEE